MKINKFSELENTQQKEELVNSVLLSLDLGKWNINCRDLNIKHLKPFKYPVFSSKTTPYFISHAFGNGSLLQHMVFETRQCHWVQR